MSRALVIGDGAAGTFSSWLLSKRGWEVTLAGRGTPCASMSAGCLRAAPRECRPEVLEFLHHEKMPWATGVREGVSRIGTSYRCWMSPKHSTWTEGEAPESMAVVGLEGHPSLPARVASAVLKERGIRAEPIVLSSSVPSDVPLASSFHNDEAWEVLAEELEDSSAEAVLLPAIVPLQDYDRLDRLERRCGKRILEAITPLSSPGQRLTDIMLSKAREAGVTIWDGRKVTALEVHGNRVGEATVLGGREARNIAVDAVVIATGGPVVDGLNLKERAIEDPFGRFQVVGDGDPLKGGYAVSNGRLISSDGRVMANAAGAGDCLRSVGREYGSGLTQAFEGAYLAVRALEVA